MSEQSVVGTSKIAAELGVSVATLNKIKDSLNYERRHSDGAMVMQRSVINEIREERLASKKANAKNYIIRAVKTGVDKNILKEMIDNV